MIQKFTYNQTLKQKLNLNQKMINSLDFLKLDNESMQRLISESLQTNPFLELKNTYTDDSFSVETISSSPSLQEDLYLQLTTYPDKYEKNIVSFIIESLNDYGFLSYPVETYLNELNIDQETFDKHLSIVQSLEPCGVGAKDIIDCICLQLKSKNKINAYHLMKNYKEIILTQNYLQIEKKIHLTRKEINTLFEDIKQCNPYPCSDYSPNSNEYIVPDINIEIENGDIIITPIHQPNIMINTQLYETVKNNNDMKKYFQDAHFILENLTKRNQTVLMIANALVEIQKSYFLYDDELISCTLQDIANECHFHESTISRTINNKYYSFHNEVYPLKHLFVSKTTSGDSSDAIKKAIVLLINNEDKQKPLSDEKIVAKLEELELYCSRRVITKYRQQLNIPSSSKRKMR